MLPPPRSAFRLGDAARIIDGATPGDLQDVSVGVYVSDTDGAEMVRIQGRVGVMPEDGMLNYFAPASPERRASFSGSGLAFANAGQAFDGTRNRGTIALGQTETETSGSVPFSIDVPFPNGYYSGLGMRHVSPAVHVWYVVGGQRRVSVVQVGEYGAAFRTLSHPSLPAHPPLGPTFYSAHPTVARSQEDILRASDYPSRAHSIPPNFWGTRPPV